MVAEPLTLQQHLLGELPLVEAGDDDSTDVVEPLDVGVRDELEDVSGPLDVDLLARLAVHRQVVDGRQMVGLDGFVLQVVVGVAQPEARVGDIAFDEVDAVGVGLDVGGAFLGLLAVLRLYQTRDCRLVVVSVQQSLDERRAEKAREAGEEDGSHGWWPGAGPV